jgi:hypothetical protein
MTFDEAVEFLTVGTALIIVQNTIVTNPFYSKSEISKYLSVRREFHPLFIEACLTLADQLEDSRFTSVIPLLKSIAHQGVVQAQQTLVTVNRVLRSLRIYPKDVQDRRLLPLFRALHSVTLLTEPKSENVYYSSSLETKDLLERIVKLSATPPKIRTLFRKVLALGVPEAFVTEANPGAWFELEPERKVVIRQELAQTLKQQDEAFEIKDPEQRQQVYKNTAKKLVEIQAEAGVHKGLILQESEQEPLEKVLLKEKKQQVNGIVDFSVNKLIEDIEEGLASSSGYFRISQREWGKIKTQLKAARTFDTFKRIIQEAVDRKLLGKDYVGTVENIIGSAQKNLALKKGIPLAPLNWEPKTAEDLQTEYDVGDVWVSGEMDQDQRSELLGRVGRAISDLEMVFGKGFCGKHAKKLTLSFKSGEGIGSFASASYFGWHDRNKWQPEVRFGKDYPGLLAHELSHFLDDQLAFRIEKTVLGLPEFQYGDVAHGKGDLFGNTGVTLTNTLKYQDNKFSNAVNSQFPEIKEWMEAIVASPDYERWKDLVPAALEMALPKAIEKVTGKSAYDSENYPMLNIDRKSQLPPEILKEAEAEYARIMGGDTRKLNYFESGVEVWARMCEQYVYTRLSEMGIANPWLTKLTYEDDPKFMDQDRFEEIVKPIMDKMFRSLKSRGIMAKKKLG